MLVRLSFVRLVGFVIWLFIAVYCLVVRVIACLVAYADYLFGGLFLGCGCWCFVLVSPFGLGYYCGFGLCLGWFCCF